MNVCGSSTRLSYPRDVGGLRAKERERDRKGETGGRAREGENGTKLQMERRRTKENESGEGTDKRKNARQIWRAKNSGQYRE